MALVGVEGQFIAIIKIDGIDDDFMDSDDLHQLMIVEEAGNVLPTFSLAFTTMVEDVVTKLNEGNLIKVSMGATLDEMDEYYLSVQKFHQVDNGNTVDIECTGFASKLTYITNQPYNISEKVSGVEALIASASRHYEVDTNIEKSKDTQNWVQHSITDKKFVNETLMHSYVPNSFLACAITGDGKFILRDIAKLAKTASSKYDWKFAKDSDGKDTTIVTEGESPLKYNGGLLNNWVGYKNMKSVIDISVSENTELFADASKNLFALSDNVALAGSVENKFTGSTFFSDNVHKFYHTAYENNLKGLANLCKVTVPVSFTGEYKAIKPLQVAMFVQQSASNEDQASEFVSGLYIISKVVKTIQSKTLNYVVMLNREALNVVELGDDA